MTAICLSTIKIIVRHLLADLLANKELRRYINIIGWLCNIWQQYLLIFDILAVLYGNKTFDECLVLIIGSIIMLCRKLLWNF